MGTKGKVGAKNQVEISGKEQAAPSERPARQVDDMTTVEVTWDELEQVVLWHAQSLFIERPIDAKPNPGCVNLEGLRAWKRISELSSLVGSDEVVRIIDEAFRLEHETLPAILL